MKKMLIPILVLSALGIVVGWVALNKEAQWSGVDETVVKKFAEESGRPPAESFIRGDALLFFFLIAGTVGGFVAGYYYRGLFPPDRKVGNQYDV